MAVKSNMNWDNFSNIIHRSASWASFVIVSAELWIGDRARTEGENALKTDELEQILIDAVDFPTYYKVYGNYNAENEQSFIIPNISLKRGIELGMFGEQDSIIFGKRRGNVSSQSIRVDKGETLYDVRMPLCSNPTQNDAGSNDTVYIEMNPELEKYFSRFPSDVLEKWSFRIFDPNFETSDKFEAYEHQTTVNLDFRTE